MRKILLILESRASYGYSKNLLQILDKNNNIKCRTLVTGTHLSKELGSSVKEILKDKIKIDYKLNFEKKDLALGIGKIIINFQKILKKFDPDIVVIFGDRVELIGIAIACSYSNKVVAHVQAGDRSGHIDDMTRMALAKLSHIHFPATKLAANRLIKLGEQKKRIYLVGAPQLDDIDYKKIKKKEEIYIDKKKINLKNRYLVVLQHSVFRDSYNYYNLFKKTLDACVKTKMQVYIIYPNYDPGYKSIIKLIKKYNKKNKKFTIFKNLNRDKYLTLVSHAQALIGNSSSGILEAPSLKVGVVNIGDRQNYREQNNNIFNANYNSKEIYNKIILAIKNKPKFLNIKNIHGDGKSSERISIILKKIRIDKILLHKNTTY